MAITIKPNACIILTVNIDVNDALVNGVSGTIKYIPPSLPNNLPPYNLVDFDNAAIGTATRSTKQHSQYPNSTPILPHIQSIHVGPTSVLRSQYPFS